MRFGTLAAVVILAVAGCEPASPTGDGGVPPGTPSNRARFTLDCDLQGVNGILTIDIEAVSDTGIVWGGGSNPDITGVIATGGVTYYTSGTVVSPVASYVFTGENLYADFTDLDTLDRFRVMWATTSVGLDMIVNPHGPGPARHTCVLTSSQYL